MSHSGPVTNSTGNTPQRSRVGLSTWSRFPAKYGQGQVCFLGLPALNYSWRLYLYSTLKETEEQKKTTERNLVSCGTEPCSRQPSPTPHPHPPTPHPPTPHPHAISCSQPHPQNARIGFPQSIKSGVRRSQLHSVLIVLGGFGESFDLCESRLFRSRDEPACSCVGEWL